MSKPSQPVSFTATRKSRASSCRGKSSGAPGRPSISLLHPTFQREGGAAEHKEAWLNSAQFPKNLEYLFAVTYTDVASVQATSGHDRVVIESSDDFSTAVAGWNALATVASGSLLFAIADDLEPRRPNWDLEILKLLENWDPLKHSYAVKIKNSPNPNDTLVRHPLVSRAYFDRHGLWDGRYKGMYVDRDFTLSAFWRSRILDRRQIEFLHNNPVPDPSTPASVSFIRANREKEYAYGGQLFQKSGRP